MTIKTELEDAKTHIGNLLEQIYQMQAMFPNDQALEEAIVAAELFLCREKPT